MAYIDYVWHLHMSVMEDACRVTVLTVLQSIHCSLSSGAVPECPAVLQEGPGSGLRLSERAVSERAALRAAGERPG